MKRNLRGMLECDDMPLFEGQPIGNDFTPEDLAELRTFRPIIQPYLETILNDFYEYASRDEDAAVILGDPKVQARVKGILLRHWNERVFAGVFNDAYVKAVSRIGLAHMHANVGLRLYIGGYGFILRELTNFVAWIFEHEPERLMKVMSVVQKAVFLDMKIAASVYSQKSTDFLREISRTDQLTRIPNRRALSDGGLKAFSEARQQNHPLSVAILDIDHFKHINDSFGHDVGDYVLQSVADCLRKCLGSPDLFGRWGGDEFLIILPNSSYQTTAKSLQRLLSEIRKIRFHVADHEFHMTSSIGIAELSQVDPSFDLLVKRADIALYEAKVAGRDCVTSAEATESPASPA